MLGPELKHVRESHNLTQRAMGELLGYTANYISRLERDDEAITPRFEKLVRAVVRKRKTVKSSEPS